MHKNQLHFRAHIKPLGSRSVSFEQAKKIASAKGGLPSRRIAYLCLNDARYRNALTEYELADVDDSLPFWRSDRVIERHRNYGKSAGFENSIMLESRPASVACAALRNDDVLCEVSLAEVLIFADSGTGILSGSLGPVESDIARRILLQYLNWIGHPFSPPSPATLRNP